MKVLELKGLNSMAALNAFSSLILGLKMLPSYYHESYESFLAKVHLMDEPEQEKVIREALMFVELPKDEMEKMLLFCTDANGVPYTKENIKNLGPAEIIEGLTLVAKEIAKLNIGILSDDEKKK